MTITSCNKFFKSMNFCSLLFPYLSEKEQNTLTSVNCLTQQITIEYAVKGYKDLHERITQNDPLIIKDPGIVYTVPLGRVLGSGGSKQAIELDKGRALLIPNEDCLSLDP